MSDSRKFDEGCRWWMYPTNPSVRPARYIRLHWAQVPYSVGLKCGAVDTACVLSGDARLDCIERDVNKEILP